MTKDRKAYFREYQRKRYSISKQLLEEFSDKAKRAEETALTTLFKDECTRLDLWGQKKWRARAKLKRQMGLEENPSESKLRAFLYQRAKQGAVARNIDFDITFADILLPEKCAILGVDLDYKGLTDRNAIYKPSIDRIDNTKGYIKGNIQVISHRANILKRDATKTELRALGAWASIQIDD